MGGMTLTAMDFVGNIFGSREMGLVCSYPRLISGEIAGSIFAITAVSRCNLR